MFTVAKSYFPKDLGGVPFQSASLPLITVFDNVCDLKVLLEERWFCLVEYYRIGSKCYYNE